MKQDWKKVLYIAKKTGVEDSDEYGVETAVYDKPTKYEMNYQPISSEADIAEFGEHASQMQKAVIEKSKYLNKFSEFDVAYLDGATPTDEEYNGANANYRLYPPRIYNKTIALYFERLDDK